MESVPVAVEFQTSDGITLRGLQWGGGSDWLIFVHDCDGESDLDNWRPIRPALMKGDWSMLAFDLRGHGASDSELNLESTAVDLKASIQFAQSHGATWTAILAPGQSAIAALSTATHTALDALVLLSPSSRSEENQNFLRGSGEAKLFAVGGKDVVLHRAVARLRSISIGWAMLVTVPTAAQGTDLLSGELTSQMTERIVAFLAEQRFIAKTRDMPVSR